MEVSRKAKYALGLCLLLFILAVWPTPYHYHQYAEAIVRINRITGGAEILSVEGWLPMKP